MIHVILSCLILQTKKKHVIIFIQQELYSWTTYMTVG